MDQSGKWARREAHTKCECPLPSNIYAFIHSLLVKLASTRQKVHRDPGDNVISHEHKNLLFY